MRRRQTTLEKRTKARRATHNDVAAQDVLMRGLLSSVTAFMLRAGMSTAQIRSMFQQCTIGRGRRTGVSPPSDDAALPYGRDTIAGAVLRAWHKLPKYIDANARPIPLRARGPDPNIESLVLGQDRNANVGNVILSMLTAGLIRKKRNNTYLPMKDSATITTLDPLSVDHIAKTVMRLVETASRNTGHSRKRIQLIERYAHVPDLSRREARAFAVFSRQQGQAYLDSIEDWLEIRQIRNANGSVKRGGGVSAGVHVFAYLADRPSSGRGIAKGAKER